jgi:hypothetical protein
MSAARSLHEFFKSEKARSAAADYDHAKETKSQASHHA